MCQGLVRKPDMLISDGHLGMMPCTHALQVILELKVRPAGW